MAATGKAITKKVRRPCPGQDPELLAPGLAWPCTVGEGGGTAKVCPRKAKTEPGLQWGEMGENNLSFLLSFSFCLLYFWGFNYSKMAN